MSFLNMFKHAPSPDQPKTEESDGIEKLSVDDLHGLLNASVEERRAKYIQNLPRGFEMEMIEHLTDDYIVSDVEKVLKEKENKLEMVA